MTQLDPHNTSDDAFDALIHDAMTRRAVDPPQMNLAAEALSRVRAQDARGERLLVLGRRLRLCGVVAGLLVAMTIAYSYMKLPTSSEGSTEYSMEVSSSSSDTQSPALMLLGASVVGLAIAAVMRPDRAS